MSLRAEQPKKMSSDSLRGRVYQKLAKKAMMEQTHNMFLLFDLDGGGTLDAPEIKQGLERFGIDPSDEQMTEYFQQCGCGQNEEKSGTNEYMNKDQFMLLLANVMKLSLDQKNMAGFRGRAYTQVGQKAVWEQSQKFFQVFDEDRSGTLDAAEITRGVREKFGVTLSDVEVEELFKKCTCGDSMQMNVQELMLFLTLFLKLKEGNVQSMKQGTKRAEVYATAAQFSVDAIREAVTKKEGDVDMHSLQDIINHRPGDLPKLGVQNVTSETLKNALRSQVRSEAPTSVVSAISVAGRAETTTSAALAIGGDGRRQSITKIQ